MSYSFQNKPSSSAVTVGEMNEVVNGVERPYKVYTALLTQSGTDAPVEITVLENTLISNILFEYENVGTYLISGIGYPSIFKYNKTFVIIGNSTTQDNSVVITAYPADEGSVRINTTISNVLTDGITGDFFPIEIRVYN